MGRMELSTKERCQSGTRCIAALIADEQSGIYTMKSRMRSILVAFTESMSVASENHSSTGSVNANLLTSLPRDDAALQIMLEGWTFYGVGRYSMVVNSADDEEDEIDARSDHMDPEMEL